jgi:hypothetical protein
MSESEIFFDPKEKAIRGPGFSIKHPARRPEPPYDDLFIYEDASGRFCFIASRNVWDAEQKYWRDTQIYDVKWIGFPAFLELKVLFENQITPEHRRRALQNIERALWFDQSAFYEEPVKGVRISVK